MQKASSKDPSFRRIRMELARSPNHPGGNTSYGYILVAPLDPNGKLNASLWRSQKDSCRVVRFRPDAEDEIGHLVHRPGGSWAFHYDIEGEDDDESGYRLNDEQFRPGEYVSVKSTDGLHTYRVISVEAL